MKILFIAPRLPVPIDTGAKIRTFNILKQLVKFAKVDLVCFSFNQDDNRYVKSLTDINVSCQIIPSKDIPLIKKAWITAFHKMPFSVWKYYSYAMQEKIKKLAAKNRYDAVHIDHIHMAHYSKHLNIDTLYIDEHNVEYKILERCARVEKSIIKRQIFYSQAKKMMKFETQRLSKFSAVFTVSSDDAKLVRKITLPSCNVYVIPNGVDTTFFNPRNIDSNDIEKEPYSLVFTGSMDWLPNEDAVIYFCKKILPLIWGKNHKIKFYVVGKNPSESLRTKIGKDNRIVFTGRVDDIRRYVLHSPIFVVPLRIGGGTRLKILEAMSMERAVVSTTIGAEGINYTDGANIIIADSPEKFSKEILNLIESPDKIMHIGKAARSFVCNNYDWSIVGERLKQIYTGLS